MPLPYRATVVTTKSPITIVVIQGVAPPVLRVVSPVNVDITTAVALRPVAPLIMGAAVPAAAPAAPAAPAAAGLAAAAVPVEATITAGGAPAAPEPTAELGGNGVIEIGPADVAGQRSMQEITDPALAAGEDAIPLTGVSKINRASRARTTETSLWICHGEVSFSRRDILVSTPGLDAHKR